MALGLRNGTVLVTCLLLMVGGQILFKMGLAQVGTVDVSSSQLFTKVLQIVRTWRVLAGLALFGVATLFWFDLLSRLELSFLYPFMSLTYVLAWIAGWLWLGETPQASRLVGIAVICLGIWLVSRTGS